MWNLIQPSLLSCTRHSFNVVSNNISRNINIIPPILTRWISNEFNTNLQIHRHCRCSSMPNSQRLSSSNSLGVSHRRNHLFISSVLSRNVMSGVVDSKGFFSKLKQKIGFMGKMKYNQSQLKVSAVRLYLCCVELPEYDVIFQEMNMPDTFSSWHRIAELHIWMLFVRLASEGREGRYLRNQVMKNMWKDLDVRVRKLGPVSASVKQSAVQELAEQLKAALYSYDEGLLDDDKVLAGALWRTFFEFKCDDPVKLADLVTYVRKQIHHLESQDTNVLLSSGLMTFLPLHDKVDDKKRTKDIMNEILKRA